MAHPSLAPARTELAAQLRRPITADPWPWLRALARFDRQVHVRASVAAARLLLDEHEQRVPLEDLPREAIEAAEAWCACPCTRHQLAARQLVSRRRNLTWLQETSEYVAAARAAGFAFGSAHAYLRAIEKSACLLCVWLGSEQPAREVAEAIRTELLPWALGCSGSELQLLRIL